MRLYRVKNNLSGWIYVRTENTMKLYRGKNDAGAWVYGGITENKNFITSKFQFIPVKSETVGMCTGIKDCNDQLIYEGDIVATENVFNTLKYVVIWDSKYASFCLQSIDNYQLKKLLYHKGYYQVVGNIIDDAEEYEINKSMK